MTAGPGSAASLYPPTATGLPDSSKVRAADPAKGVASVYLGLDTLLPELPSEKAMAVKSKFPHFPGIVDQTRVRREYIIRIPRAIEDWANRHLLADARDTIMLSTLANMIISTSTLSLLLFAYPSHMLGAFVVVCNAVFWTQRFILMLHYAEHRPIFARPYTVLRYVMPWVMAPFYGIPVGMYRTHHIIMHHKENNMWGKDLSSTEPYQRDNVLHFLHYWLKFLGLIVLLPLFAFRQGRWGAFFEVAAGCSAWAGTQYLLYQHGHGLYAFYQFQVSFLIASLALMFGNWSQHIFVHPSVAATKEGLSSYKFNCALTMNVMNHLDNQMAFNDGYHITHHIKPRCHWTEMPLEFASNLEQYAEHDPVVFDRTGFFDVGFNVLIRSKFDPEGSWRWLYEHFVHLTPERRSFEEVKGFLQERLRPIPKRRS